MESVQVFSFSHEITHINRLIKNINQKLEELETELIVIGKQINAINLFASQADLSNKNTHTNYINSMVQLMKLMCREMFCLKTKEKLQNKLDELGNEKANIIRQNKNKILVFK
jgi:hypothetical protein